MAALAASLRWARLKRRIYAILEGGLVGDKLSHAVHVGIVALILISVMAVILESVPALRALYAPWFLAIEIIAAVVFTCEYALRLWVATEHPPLRGKSSWKAAAVFARSPAMLLDACAILPMILVFLAPDALQVLLIIRLIRFFKLTRYSPGMHSLQEAILQERRALLACLIILCGLVTVAASAMHLAEQDAQPDKFGSIPESMWWAIITLTTVGYGDAVPVTTLGKMIASVTALGGLVMLALPVGIIATSFAEVIRRREFVVTWGMVVGELLRVMRAQMVAADTIIVRKGEHGDQMYLVASGSVEALLPEGRLVLGEGDYFCENSVMLDLPCNATVKALEPTRLLVLRRDDLEDLLDREPHLRADIEKFIDTRQS
jgi:voltage-gated potassium channel